MAFFVGCLNRSDAQVKNPKFQKKLQWLLRHNVEEISIKEAKALESATYLDSREKSEYETSHIKNAIWVGYNDFDINSVESLDKTKPIVIYCSVGYRSEKVTKKLEKAGFTKVYNLYGGLFEWYNEGLPIVDNNDEQTDKIHTYNKKWSKWVNKRKQGKLVY